MKKTFLVFIFCLFSINSFALIPGTGYTADTVTANNFKALTSTASIGNSNKYFPLSFITTMNASTITTVNLTGSTGIASLNVMTMFKTTNITGNIIPQYTNSSDLGSASNYFNNGYISTIAASSISTGLISVPTATISEIRDKPVGNTHAGSIYTSRKGYPSCSTGTTLNICHVGSRTSFLIIVSYTYSSRFGGSAIYAFSYNPVTDTGTFTSLSSSIEAGYEHTMVCTKAGSYESNIGIIMNHACDADGITVTLIGNVLLYYFFYWIMPPI